ncbi:hypothetical protein BZA05DRAFT_416263 [Tricharina praecox]|uniref:uncharacterized protein n=1 Tax=Tricharina praecox TaxID=43433 RepID=UPI00222015FC|nr:uncharacterized protein BZA05DRAFT_416263 [Tricharina praecox]KAI5856610.1 hypothetical protein BZA05DRAFT_416263 [Tricharina praecox]
MHYLCEIPTGFPQAYHPKDEPGTIWGTTGPQSRRCMKIIGIPITLTVSARTHCPRGTRKRYPARTAAAFAVIIANSETEEVKDHSQFDHLKPPTHRDGISLNPDECRTQNAVLKHFGNVTHQHHKAIEFRVVGPKVTPLRDLMHGTILMIPRYSPFSSAHN